MAKAKLKVVPDAAARYARVAELWAEVRVEEAGMDAAKLTLKAHRDAREELLARIGGIFEETQLLLPLGEPEEIDDLADGPSVHPMFQPKPDPSLGKKK